MRAFFRFVFGEIVISSNKASEKTLSQHKKQEQETTKVSVCAQPTTTTITYIFTIDQNI
jgi:hypothetical protein